MKNKMFNDEETKEIIKKIIIKSSVRIIVGIVLIDYIRSTSKVTVNYIIR